MKQNDARKSKQECPAGEELLAMLMGEVEGDRRGAIEAHLEDCAACRESLASSRTVVQELRELDEPVNVSLDTSVLERLDAPSVFRARWLFSGGRGALLKAAALVLAVLGACWVAAFLLQARSEGGDARLAQKAAAEWLQRQQAPDGGWNAEALGGRSEYAAGLNGLALGALARETADSEGMQQAVLRGAYHLMSGQAADGRLARDDGQVLYNHGLATLGLLEAYAATGDQDIARAARSALAFIEERQHVSGGWSYRPGVHQSPNMSVTAWQMIALQRADGLGWERWYGALQRGRAWVANMQAADGSYGYQHGGVVSEGSSTATAMGLYCSLAADEQPASVATRDVLDRLTAAGDVTYYRAFFRAGCLALLDVPGADRELRRLQAAVSERQDHESTASGSWAADDRWGSIGGRLYSTGLASLVLAQPTERSL